MVLKGLWVPLARLEHEEDQEQKVNAETEDQVLLDYKDWTVSQVIKERSVCLGHKGLMVYQVVPVGKESQEHREYREVILDQLVLLEQVDVEGPAVD